MGDEDVEVSAEVDTGSTGDTGVEVGSAMVAEARLVSGNIVLVGMFCSAIVMPKVLSE